MTDPQTIELTQNRKDMKKTRWIIAWNMDQQKFMPTRAMRGERWIPDFVTYEKCKHECDKMNDNFMGL